jgi:hypothetical protein
VRLTNRRQLVERDSESPVSAKMLWFCIELPQATKRILDYE